MRIVVAMSGGVDSSTVAGLLAAQGHEVIGVTLQLYDHAAAARRKGACCAGEDIHDARRVADRLGIAHYVIDAERRFADTVIQDFANSYAAGETPVPCVRCNQTVKFADLTRLARGLGAERLATGHYVRRAEGPDGAELHRATDETRDQSWFLFATTRAQLDFALFPLGDYPDKDAVRATASDLGLAVAAKPDSQDLCFAPDGDHHAVIARLRPDALAPGEIVGADGTLLGRHDGIARYTVGQSRRLGPAGQHGGTRQVVTRIEPATRRLILAPRGSGVTHFTLSEMNWLIPTPATPLRCAVKLRARDTLRPATITATPNGATVALDSPALPAPGQACVLYANTRVLGGGFIRRDG
jgi:tRNA-specific 2-thiouridylase